MPGLVSCGRCGASLQLGALTIDVNPPRAGKWSKRLRTWLPTARFGLRRQGATVAKELTGLRISDAPAVPVLLRLIVPGWPQKHLGHANRARWFLRGFLACLVPGILLVGSPLGSVLLGLAVAVHLSSALDLVLTGDPRSRAARAILCCALVLTVVYVPAGWLGWQVAAPRRMQQNVGPFASGDVVLVNSAVYAFRDPAPGDVVLYATNPTTVSGWYHGRNANYLVAGERIDRILAGPGQTLEIDAGQLLVNGQPAAHSALNPAHLPATLKVEVPESSYLILPTTALGDEIGMRGLDWQSLSVVRSEQIVGRAWLRHYPFWRLWWIR